MKSRLSPQERLHQIDIPLIGLTGGIASGKSTVATLFSNKGIAVISADKLIKKIYKQEKTKYFIHKNIPQCIEDKNINFSLLRQKAFQYDNIRILLENFLHPQLSNIFKKELQTFSSPHFVIYDIPLLFEKSLQNNFDLVVCVYCTPKQQKERLLSRDGIDKSLARAMLERQVNIDKKKELADVTIDNSGNLEQLSTQVDAFFKQYL